MFSRNRTDSFQYTVQTSIHVCSGIQTRDPGVWVTEGSTRFRAQATAIGFKANVCINISRFPV
jgi:hypothetical protein